METEALAALLGAAAVLIGTLIKLAGRRPDTATVLVKASESLVISQSTVLKETQEAYARTRNRVDDLERREQERDRTRQEEMDQLRQMVTDLHKETKALTRSRDEARDEVNRLRLRVQLLEDTLRSQNIPIPEEHGDPLL